MTRDLLSPLQVRGRNITNPLGTESGQRQLHLRNSERHYGQFTFLETCTNNHQALVHASAQGSSGEIPCSGAHGSSHFSPNSVPELHSCALLLRDTECKLSPDFWVAKAHFEMDVMDRELSWVWIFLAACGHCTSRAHVLFGERVPCLGTSAVALGATDPSCVLPALGFGSKCLLHERICTSVFAEWLFSHHLLVLGAGFKRRQLLEGRR